MQNRLLSVSFAAALAAVASSSFAGFTVTTGADVVQTPDGPVPGPQVGDSFTVSGGTFAGYVGDTPADPQLTGADLPFYRYNLTGAVSSADLSLGVVGYAGTYQIFYDLNSNGLPDENVSVSSGNFAISATFVPATNNAALVGSLTQTAGPSNPAFSDLSYGGSPVLYTGTYTGTNPGVSGVLNGVLRQNAIAPEPTSLGVALLAFAGRRRR